MFCFAFRHFGPAAYGNADDAFIKSGFRRWKKAHKKGGSIARHLRPASTTSVKTVEKLGLDYKSSLIGLGFDGASVMSGGISDVQKPIQEKVLFAYYVHSYGPGSIWF